MANSGSTRGARDQSDDEDLLAVGVLVLLAGLVLLVSDFEVESDFVLESESESDLGLAAELELYRSEYQPPPLRMNPPPREICRLACGSPQLGQSFNGSSEMDCWASQRWPQASHKYS